MPTADAVYQTSISINGKVDDAIFKGIAKLGTETGKVVKQEKELAVESKKSFEALEKGMAKATSKTKEMALAMKDLLLPLLGISVAFKGMQTIADTLQAAIDKFKGAREAAAAFKASIQDVVGKGKLPLWDAFFGKQSEHVLARFKGPAGPVYGRGITRAVQEAFMQQHMQASNSLLEAVIERAVHVQGSLGITPDQVGEIARKWATLIRLQKGRIPPELISELGLSSVKDLQAMSRAQKEALLVKEFGGMTDVESLIAENPHMAELLGLKTKQAKALGEAGGPLADLQTQGQIISASLELAFLPVLKTISEAIDTYLKGPLEYVKQQVGLLGLEMKFIFNPEKTLYGEETPLKRFLIVWDNIIMPGIYSSWQTFATWAGGVFSQALKQIGDSWHWLGDQINLWRESIKTLGAKRIDIGYGITVEEQPGARRMSEFIEAVISTSVNIGKMVTDFGTITASMAKIAWDTMQTAVVELADAAKRIADAINLFPKANAEAAAQLRKELQESGALPGGGGTPSTKPFKTSGFAMGGFVNAPQVGLIGEAGKESIIPLTKKDSNTLGILSGTFSALGLDPNDPNAYGHELFDSMRMGPGGIGGGGFPIGSGGGTQVTHYGYPGDETPDYYSAHGIGDHNNALSALYSVALTKAERFARFGTTGGSTGNVFEYQGHTFRDDDTAPEANRRIDIYDPGNVLRLAAGGIVSKRVLSWLGEAGSEAVVPLEGSRGKRALAGLQGPSSGHSFTFAPTINVSGIATSEVVEELSSELQRNFSRWIEDAHFEHERRAFS